MASALSGQPSPPGVALAFNEAFVPMPMASAAMALVADLAGNSLAAFQPAMTPFAFGIHLPSTTLESTLAAWGWWQYLHWAFPLSRGYDAYHRVPEPVPVYIDRTRWLTDASGMRPATLPPVALMVATPETVEWDTLLDGAVLVLWGTVTPEQLIVLTSFFESVLFAPTACVAVKYTPPSSSNVPRRPAGWPNVAATRSPSDVDAVRAYLRTEKESILAEGERDRTYKTLGVDETYPLSFTPIGLERAYWDYLVTSATSDVLSV